MQPTPPCWPPTGNKVSRRPLLYPNRRFPFSSVFWHYHFSGDGLAVGAAENLQPGNILPLTGLRWKVSSFVPFPYFPRYYCPSLYLSNNVLVALCTSAVSISVSPNALCRTELFSYVPFLGRKHSCLLSQTSWSMFDFIHKE